jgi:mono/diheme cytochrome c family protein
MAMSRWKWALIVSGLVIALTAAATARALIESRSQALLDVRHAMPASEVRAATAPQAIAEGAHLVAVTACAICHGDDLSGRMLNVSRSTVYASNLTVLTHRLSDADLDRAVRWGLRPDGVSELAMPSHVYAAFTDDEAASIIGYLRALKPKGMLLAQPQPGLLLRANLLAGAFRLETARLADAAPPVRAGPRFDEGRHLASIACGQCHGTDLSGGRGAQGPDLTVRGYYDRDRFRALLRTGDAIGEGDMELMSRVARTSFSHFSDSEIDAIFDYLDARDRILAADLAGAAARHIPKVSRPLRAASSPSP